MAIKGQVVADFVAEFSSLPELPIKEVWTLEINPGSTWGPMVDGSSTRKGSGSGVVLTSLEGLTIEQAIRLGFGATNNESEYEVLLCGLRSALKLGVKRVKISLDSQLIVSQLTREYAAKTKAMIAYLTEVPRGQNSHADALATLASANQKKVRRTIIVDIQEKSSVPPEQVEVSQFEFGPSWIDPLIHFLKDGSRLKDKKEARKRRKISCYMKSIREAVGTILEAGRWLSGQSHRGIGGRRCMKTQNDMPEAVRSVRSSQTNLDSRLPRATRDRRWLITTKDYFTKWIEAKPLAKIIDFETKKFVWESIITRFGIPYVLVSDNGTQFEKPSETFVMGNGQAEASNKIVLDGLKKSLDSAKGRWVEELLSVLWRQRTTPRRSTGQTPSSLTYGTEAVIPLEIGLSTIRTLALERGENDNPLTVNLDLLEEKREQAALKLASYQHELAKVHDRKVKARNFHPGDLVLRKVLGNTKNPRM
ncbi:uncharacterized protein LOC119981862 [Tripterygium wilfordii]|uniref:uncharacterized protein LOC119981862 n=1 Tax=Tripterygium wilfordii TaxID=458696 RepID=UPI0018F814A8|nr:uncharacterized protein LOC119981862 [Tripterygium wilfordii]